MKTLMRSYRQTGTMPPALRNKPSPNLIVNFLAEAFLLLHSSRSAGMGGPAALSIPDILASSDLLGYSSMDEKYAFLRAMQSIDGFYLSQESARIKQESQQKPK